MCVVTLSDKLTAPVLTRLLFSVLLILIVDHRRRSRSLHNLPNGEILS